MSAILSLDRFELMWLCEGAIGKSHLRWGIYQMMVDKVWQQLTDDERNAIFTYIKRDDSWHFNKNLDRFEISRSYYLQMLARFNPANQFKITLKYGRKRTTEDAYKWEGKYFISWQRYCAPEYIVKIEQKPFKKCANDFCHAKNICLRHTYNEGDTLLNDDTQTSFSRCDFIIVDEGVIDPVAEMIITTKQINNGTEQD